jgi:hypothetical protein
MKAIELLRGSEAGQIKNIDAGAGFSIGDPRWLNRKMAGGGSVWTSASAAKCLPVSAAKSRSRSRP